MSALYELVVTRQWQVAITHIQSLADGDAADQLFHKNQHGDTAIIYACILSAPLELVQLMITKAFWRDPRKRCLLAITNYAGWTALHCGVYRYSDLAVLELLIREHPLALCTTDDEGDTPLQLAIVFDSPASMISIFTDTTNHQLPHRRRLRRSRRPRPRRRKHDPLQHSSPRHSRSSHDYPALHGYVYVRWSKRQRNEVPATGLDTRTTQRQRLVAHYDVSVIAGTMLRFVPQLVPPELSLVVG